jgi:hypothetical protein
MFDMEIASGRYIKDLQDRLYAEKLSLLLPEVEEEDEGPGTWGLAQEPAIRQFPFRQLSHSAVLMVAIDPISTGLKWYLGNTCLLLTLRYSCYCDISMPLIVCKICRLLKGLSREIVVKIVR